MNWLRANRLDVILMFVVAGAGIGLLAPDLAHDSIWSFDESFHQAVARHVYAHPFFPTLYPDPVHDTPDMYRDYWNVRVWLIKPPLAYWVASWWMLVVGKVPLAYRLGGFFAHLFSAVMIYFWGRRYAGRVLSLVAALGLLALPFGWTFVQGHFVSDELDLQLCGWLCAAMFCLFRTIQTRSLKWAALAGVATGGAILVKYVLALTPLGVAFVLWFLARRRFSDGPTTRELLTMIGTTLLVALPWNIYAAVRWPEQYALANTADVLQHLLRTHAAAHQPQWQRPPDTVFNELIQNLSGPVAGVLTILAGVWLLVRAARSRDYVLLGLAAWLWATWLGHSLPAIKMLNHTWNVVVPQFIALAIVLHDSFRRLPLAFASLAAMSTPLLVPRWEWLSKLRTFMPEGSQTRSSDVLAGLQLIALGLLLGFVVRALLHKRLRGAWMWTPGFAAALWFSWVSVHDGVKKQQEQRAESQTHFNISFSKTVGRALEALTPEQSVVMLDEPDSPAQIERHNLMFWSNRLVFNGRNPGDYPANGFHPYLVSPVAESFEPLAVPASAWLRAYDLTKPLSAPSPVPEGLTPLGAMVGKSEVVGYASEPAMPGRARYAFVVRGNGEARPMKLRFVTTNGPVDVAANPSALAMKPPQVLAQAAWFVMPVVGPRDVTRVEVLP